VRRTAQQTAKGAWLLFAAAVSAVALAQPAFAQCDDPNDPRPSYAGSIYAAVDTALGPAYLAFGKGKGPRRAIYIYFGRAF
jgi:hypothetical protein